MRWELMKLLFEKRQKKQEATHLQNDTTEDVEVSKDKLKEEQAMTYSRSIENIEIPIWRSRKIRINRDAISFRISLFLWFGSGAIFAPYISLILTHRGLPLKEFPFVFFAILPVQLALAYVCGILADKMGNAKPIIIFLMIGSILTMTGLLLSPSVKNKLCLEPDINKTCFDVFNHTLDLECCKYVCFRNFSDNFIAEDKSSNETALSVSNNSTFLDNISNDSINAFDLNSTIEAWNETCSCRNHSKKYCSSADTLKLKIIYFVLLLLMFSFWSTCYRFLDFASLTAAKKYNTDFGKERFYGVLGSLVFVTLCNFVLNIDKSEKKDYYDIVFWFTIALEILAAISACCTESMAVPPGLKLMEKSLELFKNLEIVSFIFIVFVAGSAFSFNLFYHLLFLDSLKASKTLTGIHVLTYPLYGTPIFFTSKWWLRKLGRKKILIIGFLSYAINGFCYSILYNPWLSIIIEVTKAFSFHLFWIAAVIHCREIAPEGLGATLNAIMGTVHFGFGRSFGVSVGGYLMSIYKARATFRILGCSCLATAVLYSIFLYLRHLYTCKTNREKSTDPEEMKKMNEAED